MALALLVLLHDQARLRLQEQLLLLRLVRQADRRVLRERGIRLVRELLLCRPGKARDLRFLILVQAHVERRLI